MTEQSRAIADVLDEAITRACRHALAEADRVRAEHDAAMDAFRRAGEKLDGFGSLTVQMLGPMVIAHEIQKRMRQWTVERLGGQAKEVTMESAKMGEEFSDEERRALCDEAPRWSAQECVAYERECGCHPSHRVPGGFEHRGNAYDVDGLDAVLRMRRDAAKRDSLPAAKPAEAERRPMVGDVWEWRRGTQWSRVRLTHLDSGVWYGTREESSHFTVGADARVDMDRYWTLLTPAAAPLGEMLPNGFRVGERVELDIGSGWQQCTVLHHVAAAAACFGPGAGAFAGYEARVWTDILGAGRPTQVRNDSRWVRRLTPAPSVTPGMDGLARRRDLLAQMRAGTLHVAKAKVCLAAGDLPRIETEAYIAACYAQMDRERERLCPCCKDAPLRLVGEAQDVYRCGHCQWTGSAAALGRASAPLLVPVALDVGLDCPACGSMATTYGSGGAKKTHHGVYACSCGWSGGEQLAKQRRESKERRFKIGDRVRWGSAHGQVMAVVEGGYQIATRTPRGLVRYVSGGPPRDETAHTETLHNVTEADLQPWPKEAP